MGKQFHCGIELDDFEPEEFFCPCCGVERMQAGTLLRVQQLRGDLEWNKAFNIAKGGGYRCREYDKSNGAHPLGQAVDPVYARRDHDTLLGLAYKHGFTGKGDMNLVVEGVPKWKLHMDDSANAPGVRTRPYKWTYT